MAASLPIRWLNLDRTERYRTGYREPENTGEQTKLAALGRQRVIAEVVNADAAPLRPIVRPILETQSGQEFRSRLRNHISGAKSGAIQAKL
jgi:hypothetical protein